MPVFKNLVGCVFGRLTVIELYDKKNNRYRWLCKCSCGKEKIVSKHELSSGDTKSCGCLQKERAAEYQLIHGMSKTVEYKAWKSMRKRCNNVDSPDYPRYGGRGIKVCDSWNVFKNFIDDVGVRPSKNHSLDRNNNNGDYEPSNCSWVTKKEQANNTRRNRKITVNGVTKNICQIAEDLHISASNIYRRLNDGLSDYDAVFLEVNTREYRNKSRIPQEPAQQQLMPGSAQHGIETSDPMD